MKRIILCVLCLFVVGCSNVTLEYKELERIQRLPDLRTIDICNWGYIENKWRVSIGISSKCGDVDLREENRDLKIAIDKIIERAKCLQACK
jgi:hypothetical protein